MRITCHKDILNEKLQLLLKTVTTRSTMPVLSGIRLDAKATGKVEAASTNMELSLRVVFDATVEEEGAVVLPGRLFADVTRSLPPGEVSVVSEGEEPQVTVASGKASFKMNSLPASDFPRLPELPEDGVFELEAGPLTETIDIVARAASRDETRPVLTGILVKFGKSSIKMVATDSYRLSVKETKVKSSLAEKKEAIVPRQSLEELSRIIAAAPVKNVRIGMADGQIVYGVGETTVASRLIEGQFPNYQQLLPEEFKHEIALDREEILEVVSRIGIMAQKNAPLKMRFTAGELIVSAQTPQVGEATESLPVPFEGEEIEVGFNPEFLREGLESVPQEQIFLRIISPLRPGLLKGKEDDFFYLVMPVRLTA